MDKQDFHKCQIIQKNIDDIKYEIKKLTGIEADLNNNQVRGTKMLSLFRQARDPVIIRDMDLINSTIKHVKHGLDRKLEYLEKEFNAV